MKNKIQVYWMQLPEGHDYEACFSYLCLTYDEQKSREVVDRLEKSEMTTFKAKDIFRSSGLKILGKENYHVRKNITKMKNGKKMSPILLIRDEKHGRVIIGDGFHRISAIYTSGNEDCDVPCKIVSIK